MFNGEIIFQKRSNFVMFEVSLIGIFCFEKVSTLFLFRNKIVQRVFWKMSLKAAIKASLIN